jgi:Rod binding domain-containing protein
MMQVKALAALSAVPAAPAPLDKKHEALKKATQQFESYFVDEMLKEMRKTIPEDTLLGDSDHQQEIFQDMSDQAVADSVSKTGSFGLAAMMYKELAPSLPPNGTVTNGTANGAPVAPISQTSQTGLTRPKS